MPLIDSQLRTPGGPRHRPHILLVVGLIGFLTVVSLVGGWVG